MNCLHKVKEKVVFIFVLFCFAKNVLFFMPYGYIRQCIVTPFCRRRWLAGAGKVGGGWGGNFLLTSIVFLR